MYFTVCHVTVCYAWFRNVTVSSTQVNLSAVRRLRINKWAGFEGLGAAQQLWRQIFPLWISKAGKGVFGEETEGCFVPFSDRSTLQISPPIPLSLSQSRSLNSTVLLPRPPALSWSSHKPTYLRDAIASLPFPPAHPCSTGKKWLSFYTLTQQTWMLSIAERQLFKMHLKQKLQYSKFRIVFVETSSFFNMCLFINRLGIFLFVYWVIWRSVIYFKVTFYFRGICWQKRSKVWALCIQSFCGPIFTPWNELIQ